MSGNEKALGLDLMHYPAQMTEASITRNSRQLTLAGPLELVQGGQALAGRLPVFLKDTRRGATGEPVFWGFTEVVMRLAGRPRARPARATERQRVSIRALENPARDARQTGYSSFFQQHSRGSVERARAGAQWHLDPECHARARVD